MLKDRIRSLPFLVFPITLYMICAGSLFLSYLPPQTDEELYSEPAMNLATEGKMVSHIVVGMADGVYWQPPLYTWVLAGVVKTFGFTLVVIRVFSMLLGVLALILTYLVGQRFVGVGEARIAVWLLSFDPYFVIYSKLGRVDIFCLVLILSTLYFALKASQRNSLWRWVVAGIASALSVLSHPLGLAAPATVLAWLAFRKTEPDPFRFRNIAAFCVPLFFGLGVWGMHVFSNVPAFIEQMSYQFGRKNWSTAESLETMFTRFRYLPLLGLATVGSVAAAIALLLRRWREGVPSTLLAILACVLTCTIAMTYEHAYQLLLQPVVLLIVAGTLQNGAWRIHWRAQKVARVLTAALALNFVVYLGALYAGIDRMNREHAAAIEGLFARVSVTLPVGCRVLALGSPSLFWQLRAERTDVGFLTDVFLSDEKGREALRSVERIVMTRSFDPSEDDAWHANAFKRLEDLAGAGGRRIVKIASVGRRERFAYSAVVYSVMEDSSAYRPRP